MPTPPCECQNGHNSQGTQCRRSRRRERYHALGQRGHSRPAETIHRDHEDPQHHRSQAIEPAAHDRRRSQVGVGEAEREHDTKAGQHETESRQQTAPPTPARIPEKDAELRSSSPRHHVDQGQTFQKALLGEPLSLFLQLCLHDPYHRRSAVGGRPELQESYDNLLPMSCKCCMVHAEHHCLLVC